MPAHELAYDNAGQLHCVSCEDGSARSGEECPGFILAPWARSAFVRGWADISEIRHMGPSLCGKASDAVALDNALLGSRSMQDSARQSLDQVTQRLLAIVRQGPDAVQAALTAARLLESA